MVRRLEAQEAQRASASLLSACHRRVHGSQRLEGCRGRASRGRAPRAARLRAREHLERRVREERMSDALALLDSPGIVILHFHMEPTCPPCLRLAPILAKVAREEGVPVVK